MKTVGKGKFMLGFGLLITLLVCFGQYAHSAVTYDWKLPDNIRIVQPSPVDGLRTFATVQEAVNSIPVPLTDANRYLIKVMPGVYNEFPTLPRYVDLEGSGTDNTVITSSQNSTAKDKATLTVEGDSTVKNLKIVNTATANYGIGMLVNGAAKIENVKVEMTGSSSRIGIRTTQPVSVDFNKVAIASSTTNVAAENTGIELNYSTATIHNSQIILDGGDYNPCIACWYNGTTVSVRNCEFKSSNAAYTYAIDGMGGGSFVRDSKVTALGGTSQTLAMRNIQSVTNSEVRAASASGTVEAVNSVGYIATTLLEGSVTAGKIVNCWDQNYNPIPNL